MARAADPSMILRLASMAMSFGFEGQEGGAVRGGWRVVGVVGEVMVGVGVMDVD